MTSEIEHNGTQSTTEVTYSNPGETVSKQQAGKIVAVVIDGETYTNDASNPNPNACTATGQAGNGQNKEE